MDRVLLRLAKRRRATDTALLLLKLTPRLSSALHVAVRQSARTF